MRMISHDPATHNARPIFLQTARLLAAALMGLIFLGFTTGCGGQKDEQKAEPVEKIQAMLEKGELLVTCQDKGDILSCTIPPAKPDMKKVGYIEDTEPNLEYEDFECEGD